MIGPFAGFTHEEVGGVAVLWRRDERFQTLRCSLVLRRPFDERAAARALLPALLLQGTERDPGRVALVRRMEMLYGAHAIPAQQKASETHMLRFTLDTVAGEALPGHPDQLGLGLALLGDLLTRPRLENGAFPLATFERERRQQLDAIRTIADDKGTFAFERVCALACSTEPFARPEHGGQQAVEALTAQAVEAARSDFLSQGERVLLAHGRVDGDELRTKVGAFLAGLPTPTVQPLLRPAPIAKREVRRATERVRMQQAHLWMLWRFEEPFAMRTWPARRLLAQVLGGGPHSRLFREVREKRSLCYSIGCSPERQKGLLFVHTSLTEASVTECEAVVVAEVARIAAGTLADDDLAAARAGVLAGLRSIDDSVQARLAFTLEQWLERQDESPDQLASRYQAVTKDDVVAAARELWLDFVYLLAPSAEGAA